MIELTDDLLFAEGGRRYCFVHPDDPNKCIKVLSPNGDPAKRKREAVWYKKLRPVAMFDDNLRELKSFQELAKKGDVVWDHFPRCHGIHPTTRGDGIITDLIRDADGAVSQTVHEYVKQYGKTEELHHALNRFLCFLEDELVITRDILDHNIVAQVRECGLHIVMIDGFGSSNLFSLEDAFSSVGRVKIQRKVARFRNRYEF